MKILNSFMMLMALFLAHKATAESVENSFRIGAGDRIQIIVYGEEDLSINDLYINSNGGFDYPYLGRLSALNKTPQQLKQEITAGLKGDYLISPKVRVNIIGFRSIYVNGEVKKPGGYEYQPGLTVDKAIALAGGFTDRASKSKIFITQADNASAKARVSLTSKIAPGDILVVDQSFF